LGSGAAPKHAIVALAASGLKVARRIIMAGLRLRPIIVAGVLALAGVLQGSNAIAEIVTRSIKYQHRGTPLTGFLAYNDVGAGQRPGILIGHTWSGIGSFIRGRAEAYARLGYVAFVPDIYGDNWQPPESPDPDLAMRVYGAEMKKYMDDRALLRDRANAGLDILRAQALVDPETLLGAGYCFGGATVLELARGGAKLKALATFHGSLSNPTPETARNIMGSVLVLHGADDPSVPPAEVEAFQKEMRAASKARRAPSGDPSAQRGLRELDWQLVIYGNAVHRFTDPAAGLDPSKGYAYNAEADARSWAATHAFFRQLLCQGGGTGGSFFCARKAEQP
jgi:dienelactone hydrolase